MTHTYTHILDRFFFFLFFSILGVRTFPALNYRTIFCTFLCDSCSLKFISCFFALIFLRHSVRVNVDVRATRSALGRRKCNSVARATQSRDTVERVACSNGISTRERVRGHAHERTGARVHFGAVKARMTRQNDTRTQLRSLRDQVRAPHGDGGVRPQIGNVYFTTVKIKLQGNWKELNVTSSFQFYLFDFSIVLFFGINGILRYCVIYFVKWIWSWFVQGWNIVGGISLILMLNINAIPSSISLNSLRL